MPKNFVSIIKSVNGKNIEDNPIIIINTHEIEPGETLDYICEQYNLYIMDSYGLDTRDKIETYPQTDDKTIEIILHDNLDYLER